MNGYTKTLYSDPLYTLSKNHISHEISLGTERGQLLYRTLKLRMIGRK